MISITKLNFLAVPFLTLVLAVPESIFKRDDCHGSGRCGYGPGQPQAALSLYNIAPNNASIYNDYTSYTDGHYTSIWTCPKGHYPPNVTGAKIFEWGEFVFKAKQAGGASCGKCGTHWVPDSTGKPKCRVTMNYCKNCKTIVNGITGGGAGLPPPQVPIPAPPPPTVASATSLTTPSGTPLPGHSTNQTLSFTESALLDPTLQNPSLPPLDPTLMDPTLQNQNLPPLDPNLTDPTLDPALTDPTLDPSLTDPTLQNSNLAPLDPALSNPGLLNPGVGPLAGPTGSARPTASASASYY